MPYMPKTLKNYRKELGSNFNLDNFENIFNCLLNNIEKIHQDNIIHRDIKPENIFIVNNNFLIGDFDISKFNDTEYIKLTNTSSRERLANYAFSAPEQFDPTLSEARPFNADKQEKCKKVQFYFCLQIEIPKIINKIYFNNKYTSVSK